MATAAGPGRYLIEAERRPSLAADIAAALVGDGIAGVELAEVGPISSGYSSNFTRRPLEAAA